MIRSALAAALIAAVSTAARAERPPLQSDFGRCANAMQNSGHDADLQGQLRMELLVRRDGKVYAAFVAGERGISSRKLERCLTSEALLWVLPAVPIDYQRSYSPVSFVPGGSDNGGQAGAMGVGRGQTSASVMMPDINNPPAFEPINVEVSQQTLDVADFATLAEKGMSSLAVKDYQGAVKAFRDALAKTPEDETALRGLAQALAESGGDLTEARATADRLLKVAPASVGGHEAMVRVCLVQKDAPCIFQHFKAAQATKDFSIRSRIFKEQLETPVRQTLADAQKAAREQPAGAAAAPQAAQAPQEDECAQAKTDDAMSLCLVKRCLDAGSAQYAKELSEQNKTEYVAGEWRAKPVGTGKVLVTREIATKATPPEQHSPMWLVKLGEQVTMVPSNAEARQITLTHNACAARVNSGK